MKTKFIFITGGVVSSLGKGLSAAGIGALLKAHKLKVYMQKFDPYLNIDASLLSPLQHGEVFVTQDGAETDLDLGHYERLIDTNLTKYASLTSGRIYKEVLEKERNNLYDGKTIQVIPHITDYIQNYLIETAEQSKADVIITEIGGTVGDIESLAFIEAIRQFKRTVGEENILYIHATLLPYLKAAKEIKTKPTQHSVNTLRSLGINPNMLILRSEQAINTKVKEKISDFCGVSEKDIIEAVDCQNLFDIIPNLRAQKVDERILKHFNLSKNKDFDISSWENLITKINNLKDEITLTIIGPYIALHDAYLSIVEACKHAGYELNKLIKFNWINSQKTTKLDLIKALSNTDGVIIPGGYSDRTPTNEIEALKYLRENNIPTLGICLGHELMIIEYFQNKLGLDVSSEEFKKDPIKKNIFIKRTTPLIGQYKIELIKNSLLNTIYKKETISERFRFEYGFNPQYLNKFNNQELMINAIDSDTNIPYSVSDTGKDFYLGVQFHPEYLSRPLRAHPIFIALIKAIIKNKRKEDK